MVNRTEEKDNIKWKIGVIETPILWSVLSKNDIKSFEWIDEIFNLKIIL